jgi:hypothetical protein
MTTHPESERLARALARCGPLAEKWAGFVYRSASPEYANRDDLITGAGARKTGGRWNPRESFHTFTPASTLRRLRRRPWRTTVAFAIRNTRPCRGCSRPWKYV